jgi:hypothetical protein
MKFLKKLIAKICNWFKVYPSLSALLLTAKEKKVKLIKISPRITIYEFLGGVNYILEGVVEISAENVGAYVVRCYEQLVKYYDQEDEKYFNECEKAVYSKVEKCRDQIINEGFDVLTEKLKVF